MTVAFRCRLIAVWCAAWCATAWEVRVVSQGSAPLLSFTRGGSLRGRGGSECTFEPHTDYQCGGGGATVAAPDQQACCDSCAADHQCDVGVYGTGGQCYLKYGCGTRAGIPKEGPTACRPPAAPTPAPTPHVPGSSDFEFAYNPAFVPAASGAGAGLLVRVQRSPGAQPLRCASNRPPTSNSSLAFAPLLQDDSFGRLDAASVVFAAAGTAEEADVQDPRVVQLPNGTYVMTYTAHGTGEWPRTLRQGIATTATPRVRDSWARAGLGGETGLPPAYKSGAMLLLPPPGGDAYMFLYNLTTGHGAGAHDVVVARSSSGSALGPWHLTGQTLLPTRNGSFDAGLVEPGPPPMRLSDGNFLFVYNSAEQAHDENYHAGWAVLDGTDPTRVLQRSAGDAPLLSYTDRGYEVGNSSGYLCNVGHVVFVSGMARAEREDEFVLYYGAADAVVGSATIRVAV
jgi:predicted GH43/DUF377 family glycosyl hydrolase